MIANDCSLYSRISKLCHFLFHSSQMVAVDGLARLKKDLLPFVMSSPQRGGGVPSYRAASMPSVRSFPARSDRHQQTRNNTPGMVTIIDRR